MVSRRKFLGIILMMVVLCVIFMFAMFVQERGSAYDINRFVSEEQLSGRERWQPSGDEQTVILFGESATALETVAGQWCIYTKRRLVRKRSLADYSKENDGEPVLLLLDAENLAFEKNYSDLIALAELGIPMVFCSLPKTTDIMKFPELQELLGVKLRRTEVKVEGIRLFDGFFYGGAAEYVAKTEEEEKLQDFTLTMPWLLTQSGTKTYMVGVLDEMKENEEIRENEYPCLIWRNNYKGTRVFAVCGDYLSSLAGIGILSAFMYELQEYELYPVVNAQSIIVDNFPNFSAENSKEIERLYSRTPQMYFQGIMWPGLSALAKNNALKLTCLFKPQYDYLDGSHPDKAGVAFYLKQLREMESEAGLALGYKENTGFLEMLEADTEFFNSLDYRYRYQTTYTKEENLDQVRQELEEGGKLQNVVTVGAAYHIGDVLLSYLNEDATLQRTTGIAEFHTYTDDFILHGVQTALLYSNVRMDLEKAVWPQEEAHQWQYLFKDISSNIQTFWSGNFGLEQTTLSESDERVRILLNLDYFHERTGDTIRLEVENNAKQAWFLLRTHDEKITGIQGGTYKKLDGNMYLITAYNSEVVISLVPLSLKEQDEK